MEDFVELVDGIIRRESPDVALGYSFGGAVLMSWKHKTGDQRVKGVLVSPAILRRYDERSVSLPDFVHSGGYWRDHQDRGGLQDLGVEP